MASQITNGPPTTSEQEDSQEYKKDSEQVITTDEEHESFNPTCQQDAFGDEEFADVKYKILEWWWVSQTIAILNQDQDQRLTNVFIPFHPGNAGYSW